MRRTKIIATIGPACEKLEVMKELLLAGVDVARLNFSHNTYDYHAGNITKLRTAAREVDRPLAIMLDLQGPKIRTGDLIGHKPIILEPGKKFSITTRNVPGDVNEVSTTYDSLPFDVKAGDRLLLSDGLIELQCTKSDLDTVETIVKYGGELKEHQGINLPGVNVTAPSLTQKDEEDLVFALQHDIDYVALSFVRKASDILEIKTKIASHGKFTPVIAKIEKQEAIDDIDNILRVTDAIMIARGDLGVEIPIENVPPIQKMLIEKCNDAGIPVITATQMLESMIHNSRPTRAETTDVANAIIDGTDAVMLSGETAIGAFPVETVRMMSNIAIVAELSGRHNTHQPFAINSNQADIPASISAAANAIVNSLNVQALVAFTQTGASAQLMSQKRPRVPILAITPHSTVCNKLNLVWGVVPVCTNQITDDIHVMSKLAHQALLNKKLAKPGDTVIIVGGLPLEERGPTNFVQIVKVDSDRIIV